MPSLVQGRLRKAVLALSLASFVSNATVRFFIPTLLPFIVRDLGINEYAGSILITSYWIGYTIFQVPAGFIADRIGSSLSAKCSMLMLSAVFTVLYFIHSDYVELIVIQFLLGSSSAAVYISFASLVQRIHAFSDRARALGIYQSGFFIGYSIGSYLILYTFNVSISLPYTVIMALLFFITILDILLIEHDGTRIRGKSAISKGIVFPAIIRFAAGLSYIGFLSMFTSLLILEMGISPNRAYYYGWIPAFAGIISSPFGSTLSRLLGRGRAFLSAASVISLSFIIILVAEIHNYFSIMLSSLTGLFYGIYAGPSMSLASDMAPGDRSLSLSSSILNVSSQAGGVISPMIIGYLYVISKSFTPGLLLIALSSMALSVSSIIFLRKNAKINNDL